MKLFHPRASGLALAFIFSGLLNAAHADDVVSAKNASPQLIPVAGKKAFYGSIADDSSASLSARDLDASDRKRIKIHRPGASFIKIHFSDFNIPKGAKVIVSDPSGEQRYVYKNDALTPRTVDTQAGDDGKRSFSAMSIDGDTALVRYHSKDQDAAYSINIDYIMEGFSEEAVAAALHEAPAGDEDPITAFSTCGVNERRDVQCWRNSNPTEYERTRPVARLLITKSNGTFVCTAWRVGSGNRMFSNNHCVANQSQLNNTEVWFNYQRSGCGSGNTNGTVKVSGSRLLKTSGRLDYILFEVNSFNTIRQFGHFGLDVRNASRGERIYIPQHGAGNPKELAIQSDQNQGGVCRVDNTSTAGGRDIGYFCDTIGGSSGSPVVAANSNKVIALHHTGGCLNNGVRISGIWPEVSQFFDGVPNGDNQGTPPSDARRLRVRHSNKCVDIAARSVANGGNAQQWNCHGNDNQRFRFLDQGNGYVKIQATHSQKCLNVDRISNDNGANIHQWSCGGNGQNLQFKVENQGSGWFRLRARNSNKCLDIAGVSTENAANVQQWSCHNGENQQFRFD